MTTTMHYALRIMRLPGILDNNLLTSRGFSSGVLGGGGGLPGILDNSLLVQLLAWGDYPENYFYTV